MRIRRVNSSEQICNESIKWYDIVHPGWMSGTKCIVLVSAYGQANSFWLNLINNFSYTYLKMVTNDLIHCGLYR